MIPTDAVSVMTIESVAAAVTPTAGTNAVVVTAARPALALPGTGGLYWAFLRRGTGKPRPNRATDYAWKTTRTVALVAPSP